MIKNWVFRLAACLLSLCAVASVAAQSVPIPSTISPPTKPIEANRFSTYLAIQDLAAIPDPPVGSPLQLRLVPNDAAFAKMSPAQLQVLLSNRGKARAFLRAHTLQSRTDLQGKGKKFRNANGNAIELIEPTGDTAATIRLVDSATIGATDEIGIVLVEAERPPAFETAVDADLAPTVDAAIATPPMPAETGLSGGSIAGIVIGDAAAAQLVEIFAFWARRTPVAGSTDVDNTPLASTSPLYATVEVSGVLPTP